MKKILFSSILFLILNFLLLHSQTYAGPSDKAMQASPAILHSLKKYMQRFGSLVSGLEILKIKEVQPDWESIDLSIREIDETITEMQKLDKSEIYKHYTDAVVTQINELKKLSKKKDKKIYEGFDKLTQSCFQCHAAHRPADFLVPKSNQDLSKKSTN